MALENMYEITNGVMKEKWLEEMKKMIIMT